MLLVLFKQKRRTKNTQYSSVYIYINLVGNNSLTPFSTICVVCDDVNFCSQIQKVIHQIITTYFELMNYYHYCHNKKEEEAVADDR